MIKIIAKIFGLFFLGLLLFVFIFIVYLKSDYNASFVPSEVNQTITDIKNAKPLPESFIKVYDQVNGFRKRHLSGCEILFSARVG